MTHSTQNPQHTTSSNKKQYTCTRPLSQMQYKKKIKPTSCKAPDAAANCQQTHNWQYAEVYFTSGCRKYPEVLIIVLP